MFFVVVILVCVDFDVRFFLIIILYFDLYVLFCFVRISLCVLLYASIARCLSI